MSRRSLREASCWLAVNYAYQQDIVDRESRDKMVLLLRQLAAGRITITNDEFEDMEA
jgi:hypothetical protein